LRNLWLGYPEWVVPTHRYLYTLLDNLHVFHASSRHFRRLRWCERCLSCQEVYGRRLFNLTFHPKAHRPHYVFNGIRFAFKERSAIFVVHKVHDDGVGLPFDVLSGIEAPGGDSSCVVLIEDTAVWKGLETRWIVQDL